MCVHVVRWLLLSLLNSMCLTKCTLHDDKHFLFSCPQYEDLRESIQATGKAENITEDTVLLHFLMNSKPMCIAKFVSSAFARRGVLTAV